ncbi:Uncharacterised protein [Enterobacter hormaechei]|uniref:hypothetical protein n=1 Tax=Enterobacter hormaechei TaxID=158836 RepID=UPI000798443D|nr:hypothetical protein [Enterobacter hormaechei]CZY40738.1 Uncharacterised protein [Enterobacter hormaechei]
MEALTLLLIFIMLLSILPAMYAGSQGRNKGKWFFISIMTSPMLAFVILLCMPNLVKLRKKEEKRERERREEREEIERREAKRDRENREMIAVLMTKKN